jgi:hypothetical protein
MTVRTRRTQHLKQTERYDLLAEAYFIDKIGEWSSFSSRGFLLRKELLQKYQETMRRRRLDFDGRPMDDDVRLTILAYIDDAIAECE